MYDTQDCVFKKSRTDLQATNRPDGAKTILKARASLLSLLSDFVGAIADGPVYDEMAKDICTKLKQKPQIDDFTGEVVQSAPGSVYSAVYGSLQHVFPLGARVTPQTVEMASKRLAGNLGALKAGIAVSTWIMQPYQEWSVGRIGYIKGDLVGIEIMSGRAAGMWVEMRPYRNGLERICVTVGIVSWKDLDSMYVNPHELVGSFAQFHLDPGSGLQISDIRCMQSMRAANKKLKQSRDRMARKCPRNFVWECHECPLSTEDCSLAIREARPPIGECTNGHIGFILKHDGNLCVTCAANKWRAQRGIGPLYRPPQLRRKEENNADESTRSERSRDGVGMS